MGVEFNFDEDAFKNAIADAAEAQFREWIETEAGNGNIECDCGSTQFDIETWKDRSGQIRAAGVCRECNRDLDIDLDTSDINNLR